ncbi:MAG: thioredoxin [Fimbriimonadales bacterium]
MANALPLAAEEFDSKVASSAVPVLIDFWAAWCGPCKAIAPHVDAIAAQYAGKLNVFKVDVDAYPEFAGSFGVLSIPTLILFKGGKVVDTIVGFTSKEQIAGAVERALA